MGNVPSKYAGNKRLLDLVKMGNEKSITFSTPSYIFLKKIRNIDIL